MKRRTVMLYGSYSQKDRLCIEQLLSRFVELCLSRGFRFVTRTGATLTSSHLWPHADPDTIPVDNVVITTVGTWCTAHGKGDRICDYLRTYVNRGRTEPLNIGQEIVASPGRRYEMYTEFFQVVDHFLFIGGGDGVLRLGLICHFVKERFVAITAFGGGAAELGQSFYGLTGLSHYQNLRSSDCLTLETPGMTGQQLYNIVRRNMRRPVLFVFVECLSRRMTFPACLSVVKEALEDATGMIGRIAVGVVILVSVCLVLKKQLLDIWSDCYGALRQLFGG